LSHAFSTPSVLSIHSPVLTFAIQKYNRDHNHDYIELLLTKYRQIASTSTGFNQLQRDQIASNDFTWDVDIQMGNLSSSLIGGDEDERSPGPQLPPPDRNSSNSGRGTSFLDFETRSENE
jgi:hypothetical protein